MPTWRQDPRLRAPLAHPQFYDKPSHAEKKRRTVKPYSHWQSSLKGPVYREPQHLNASSSLVVIFDHLCEASSSSVDSNCRMLETLGILASVCVGFSFWVGRWQCWRCLSLGSLLFGWWSRGKEKVDIGGKRRLFFLPRHFPNFWHIYGHSVLAIDFDTLMQSINSCLAVDIRDTDAW